MPVRDIPPVSFALLYNSDEPLQFQKTEGFPIGIFSNSDYHRKTIAVESGMNLYLYSDGFYDVTSNDNMASSLEKLQSFLCYLQQQQGIELNELIFQECSCFPDDRQRDDLSLVQLSFL
jgi:serine phosphatase RsbU (regulator of sigma subunit)